MFIQAYLSPLNRAVLQISWEQRSLENGREGCPQKGQPQSGLLASESGSAKGAMKHRVHKQNFEILNAQLFPTFFSFIVKISCISY